MSSYKQFLVNVPIMDGQFTKLEEFSNSWIKFLQNSYQLTLEYNAKLADSASKAVQDTILPVSVLNKKDQKHMRKTFDNEFRDCVKESHFVNHLSKTINSWSKLSEFYGFDKSYQFFIDLFSSWNKLFEPLRDTVNRTESEKIPMKRNYHLLHYKSQNKDPKKTPVLIVYSLINRHYILDLLPEISVVRHFLDAGFDVYATDWETPSNQDSEFALKDYIHDHIENAVDEIRKLTGTDKITLFGYCWGGIISLIYSAMHPQTVKNLILHATPLDIEKPDTVIENWTKEIDPDIMVEKFGNVPGQLLNVAFTMRNPLETLLKYPNYFQKPRSFNETKVFFAIESWLYDSRPITGQAYREIIKKIYQQNQLIKGNMQIGNDKVNLENLTMPVLNIVGKYDDLVPPDSSKSIMETIPNSDKKMIEFPTGHVGLCISKKAHKKLWPKVTKWLDKRS